MSFESDITELLQEIEHPIKPHITQLAGKGLKGVKNTIAIASGKGGVGKSTITLNIALALQRCGAKVGILDADIYGPSIPTMLGAPKNLEIIDNQYNPAKLQGIEAMSIGYIATDEAPLIWRGPMLAKSLMHMIELTRWDDLDYLFIDLPPGTGDIQLSLVQKIPLTGAIIVTTPQNVATLDAHKALKMFKTTNIDILGVVENMSSFICSNCHHEEHSLGQGGAKKLCEEFNCTLLGNLPFDKRIVKWCDEGNTPKNNDDLAKNFIKIALQTAIEIAKKPLNHASKLPPIVTG